MAELLTGRIALVTGGASGIGRAAALALAREGAKVAVADMAADGGNSTAETILRAGGEAVFLQADVSRADEVDGLIAAVVDRFGRLDCAFNNAGVEQPMQNLAETTLEQWSRIIAVDLTGVWLCMKYEIARMLQQGGGSIVNTSSIMGI